jgi:diguanylate cyclase (GGDEF)-like protein/PAS domain S-box-containing protein
LSHLFLHEMKLLHASASDQWATRLELFKDRKNLILLVRRGLICFVNDVGLDWLGYSGKSDLLGIHLPEVFSQDYKGLVEMGLEVLAEEHMVPVKLVRHDGTEIDAEMWCDLLEPITDEIFIIEARNITEHLRAARALRSREQWLEGIINTVADGIITVDHHGTVQSFNPAAERIFKFRAEEIIGKNIRELVPTPIAEQVALEHGTEWQRMTTLGENLMGRRKDGAVFPMEMSVREMFQGDSVSYAGIVRDVSARRRAEERIRHLAQHDALTDLPNRVLLADRLGAAVIRAVRHKNQLAVIFIDLNGFKPINDTYGHAIGDEVLIGVAYRLTGSLRKSDTVARIGGDEFVALIEEVTDESQVEALAHKIIEAVTKPLSVHGLLLEVTASLGISIFPEDGDSAEALLNLADKAMYFAKQQGKGRIGRHPDRLVG